MATEAELLQRIKVLDEQLATERRLRSYAEDELRRLRAGTAPVVRPEVLATIQTERDTYKRRLNDLQGQLGDLGGKVKNKTKDELEKVVRDLSTIATTEIVAPTG